MPQSLAKVLIHLVFSTKHRAPQLPHNTCEPLRQYTFGILDDQKCRLLAMNNVVDHVHILFELHRTAALSDVVMHIKKGTSRWLKEPPKASIALTGRTATARSRWACRSNLPRWTTFLPNRPTIPESTFRQNFENSFDDTRSTLTSATSGIDPFLAGLY